MRTRVAIWFDLFIDLMRTFCCMYQIANAYFYSVYAVFHLFKLTMKFEMEQIVLHTHMELKKKQNEIAQMKNAFFFVGLVHICE